MNLEVSLLIVSQPDIASTVQGDALLARGGWTEVATVENGRSWAHNSKPVHLWWFPGRILMEDNLDISNSKDSGVHVREVIFLSRHFAASGITSLTLHVIGVQGESQVGETAEFG